MCIYVVCVMCGVYVCVICMYCAVCVVGCVCAQMCVQVHSPVCEHLGPEIDVRCLPVHLQPLFLRQGFTEVGAHHFGWSGE